MTATYVYLLIFGCFTYLIATDASIAKAVYLISQMIRFRFERFKWWVKYSPDNPIVRYLIWRRSYKLAKELEEELKSNAK
jgi:hypothetical protein